VPPERVAGVTVIVVPGPRKRRWLVARRRSSSKSRVSNQWISLRFVSATGPEHAKAARRARRGAGDVGCHPQVTAVAAPAAGTLTEPVAAKYKQMIKDQQAAAPARKVGASATPERAYI
jgi:hypothetical protein